jgi:uncharacterized Fe-S cluster-containing radical SAM superfamily protein
MTTLLDVERMNAVMRERCVDLDNKSVLLSDIAGSEQEADLTLPPNLGGIGRIRHFRSQGAPGWPENPYPGLPSAIALGGQFEPTTRAQLVQIAGCGMRCWYCFVPYRLLAGSESQSTWVTARQLVDLYAGLSDRPRILVLSGGSPDIAPEWVSWVLSAIHARGLEASSFVWSDDNLSSTLMLEEEFRPHLDILRYHRNYGRVACLKGFDAASFTFNTHSEATGFERQLNILDGYLGLGLNLYGYITLTSERSSGAREAIARLMDRIEKRDEGFLRRLLPLRVEKYGAMRSRLTPERNNALTIQDEVLAIWLEELAMRQVDPIWLR